MMGTPISLNLAAAELRSPAVLTGLVLYTRNM